MSGLVPFDRRNRDTVNNEFEDFYNLLGDYFTPKNFERATFKLDVLEADAENKHTEGGKGA